MKNGHAEQNATLGVSWFIQQSTAHTIVMNGTTNND